MDPRDLYRDPGDCGIRNRDPGYPGISKSDPASRTIPSNPNHLQNSQLHSIKQDMKTNHRMTILPRNE